MAETRASGIHIPDRPNGGWNNYEVLLNDLARDLPDRFAPGEIDASRIGGNIPSSQVTGSIPSSQVAGLFGRLGYDGQVYSSAIRLGAHADTWAYSSPSWTSPMALSTARQAGVTEILLPVSGFYEVSFVGRVDVQAAAWVYHEFYIDINGSGTSQPLYGYSIQHGYNTQGALYATHNIKSWLNLAAGTYVGVYGNTPNSGGAAQSVALQGINSGTPCYLFVEYKGAYNSLHT